MLHPYSFAAIHNDPWSLIWPMWFNSYVITVYHHWNPLTETEGSSSSITLSLSCLRYPTCHRDYININVITKSKAHSSFFFGALTPEIWHENHDICFSTHFHRSTTPPASQQNHMFHSPVDSASHRESIFRSKTTRRETIFAIILNTLYPHIQPVPFIYDPPGSAGSSSLRSNGDPGEMR